MKTLNDFNENEIININIITYTRRTLMRNKNISEEQKKHSCISEVNGHKRIRFYFESTSCVYLNACTLTD